MQQRPQHWTPIIRTNRFCPHSGILHNPRTKARSSSWNPPKVPAACMLVHCSKISEHAPPIGLALPLSCAEHLSQLLLYEDTYDQGQAAGSYDKSPAPTSSMLLQGSGLQDTRTNALDEILRAPARGSISRADTHQSSCCGPSMTCTAFHMRAFLNGLLCAASKIRQHASRADRAQN